MADAQTPSGDHDRTRGTGGPRGHRVARVELSDAGAGTARSVIRQMSRLARRLPDRVDVVVVSIPSAETLTVDLLAGLAVSRRLMAARGRQLLVRTSGRPATRGAAAVLAAMPFVVA